MKKTLLTIFTVLIALTTTAQQQGINYKALIKDDLGNVLSSAPVSVQFIITDSNTINVYQESHTENTDVNGLIIVSIGEGTTADIFADIDWENDDHFLNVQVNTGAGLVDMGTTQFMAVPYAKHANTALFSEISGDTKWEEGNTVNDIINNNTGKVEIAGALQIQSTASVNEFSIDGMLTDNSDTAVPTEQAVKTYVDANLTSGLETLDESNGIGWRLKGRDPANYGNIGSNAVDLSTSTNASTTRGATGQYSTAMGEETTASGGNSTAMGYFTNALGNFSTAIGYQITASGIYSTAMGDSTTASGNYSTALGSVTTASGNYSTVMGSGTTAPSYTETAIGRYNTIYSPISTTSWEVSDRLFVVGNGVNAGNRSDALTVYKNGNTKINGDLEVTGSNNLTSGLEALDEGNGNGWRLKGRTQPLNSIGYNAVDLSVTNTNPPGNIGATGSFSVALGFRTLASGNQSTAIGFDTTASGDGSTAIGRNTRAESVSSTAIGSYNIGGGNPSSWVATDPLFEIGNSQFGSPRSNALTVYKNGSIATNDNIASGTYSTAMGSGTTALDSYSTAMGRNTTASKVYSTAMGFETEASGEISTAMGRFTNASGYVSTAMGNSTEAKGSSTTAMGFYNYDLAGEDRLLIVGNGTNSARSNAFTVYAGTDADLTTFNSGFVMIGNNSTANLLFDTNEIMARNNGSASTLFLQQNGGNVAVNGGVVHTSDRRLKKDITELHYGLDDVLKLNPVAYNWKHRPNQKQKSLGLIAQELQNVISEIVSVEDDEKKTLHVNYTELIPVLINAIKEQQTQIESLQTKNERQDTVLNEVLKRLNSLENTKKTNEKEEINVVANNE